MAQKNAWVSKPSQSLKECILAAGKTTMCITKSSGPLSFMLHDEVSLENHKVSLGDEHCCDCIGLKKKQEPCLHICWLLMKKFKVNPFDEIIFQRGLNENYLRSLFNLERYHQTAKLEKIRHVSAKTNKSYSRRLTRDDECPICFDKFHQSSKGITQCSTCHNHVHIPCRNLWKRNGDSETKDRCPYCRGNFGRAEAVLPHYIPWKKLTRKTAPIAEQDEPVIKRITVPVFTTECVKGKSLMHESPTSPPSHFPTAKKCTIYTVFPNPSESRISGQETRTQKKESLSIAGRGLPQYNSTLQETDPILETHIEPKMQIQKHNSLNLLKKTISAIRHNQQVGNKGPSAVLGFKKSAGCSGPPEGLRSFTRVASPFHGKHPIQNVLQKSLRPVRLRQSLSEGTRGTW